MSKLDKRNNRVINVISVAVPAVVAFLLFGMGEAKGGGATWMKSLPTVNAVLNSTTSVLLVLGLVCIKQRKIALHRAMMFTSFVLGALFLVSYIIYHFNVSSVKFGDADFDGVVSAMELEAAGGNLARGVYLVVLLSHIGLSIVALPFVLRALAFAITNQIERHKKIVRWAFPFWLYVSVSGVLVYFLIRPYYLP